MPATERARATVTPIWPGTDAGRAAKIAREWTRSDTLGLANQHCTRCFGLGLWRGKIGESRPCGCVLRRIFDLLWKHYEASFDRTGQFSRCSLSKLGEPKAGHMKWSWGFPDHEFFIDFECLAKRVLMPTEQRYRSYSIFRALFLEGVDFHACCRRFGMSNGAFWHEFYRIKERIGRAARELRPYPLFPLALYYGDQSNHRAAKPTPSGDIRNANRLNRARFLGHAA